MAASRDRSCGGAQDFLGKPGKNGIGNPPLMRFILIGPSGVHAGLLQRIGPHSQPPEGGDPWGRPDLLCHSSNLPDNLPHKIRQVRGPARGDEVPVNHHFPVFRSRGRVQILRHTVMPDGSQVPALHHTRGGKGPWSVAD